MSHCACLHDGKMHNPLSAQVIRDNKGSGYGGRGGVFSHKDFHTRRSETNHRGILVFAVFHFWCKRNLRSNDVARRYARVPFRASHIPGEEVNKCLVRVVATDLSRVLLKSLFFSAAVKTPPAGLNTKAFISARTYAEDANSLANVVFPNIICGCDE